MRNKIVAGNWKMNLNMEEGQQLIEDILQALPAMPEGRRVVLAPPYIHLSNAARLLEGQHSIALGAQNCHHELSGAHTGEVSAAMLQSCGVRYVIIGHSERREGAGETDAQLAAKVNAALVQGLEVIFCCGEALEVRDAGAMNEHVGAQIAAGLFHLSADQMRSITIAYEPIWAIGTGRTASSQQAQDMHVHIRATLAAQYGPEVADRTPILYGGSCKAGNAAELFAQPDVDGGLIGGASLKAADFLPIVEAMNA